MLDESTVLVPVPRWLLREVYDLLARRMQEGHTPDRLQPSAPVMPMMLAEATYDETNLAQRNFSAAELGLLKRSLPEGNIGRTLIDMCANVPGQAIAFDDVVARAGVEPRQARGQLGALTKVLKKLFRTPEWPVHVNIGSQGQATYIMPEGMARNWRNL